MRKNYLMKSISIILMLLAMMFSCQPVSEDIDSGNSNSNNTNQGGNTGGDDTGNENTGGNTEKPQALTLQQIINDTNVGEEIDLSKYKDVTDYSATVNKTLTIKNGSLSNAKLIVTAENVKLEKLEKVSVSTSSRLTINNSKLSDLLIGANSEMSRSGTLSTEMSLAMVSVAGCEIENVELIGFNSQLNITDVKTKIDDIITSTKAKIILEAGSYVGMKDPVVTDNGELTRIDMTKEKELSILSIYSNPKKTEYEINDEIDLTGLIVMGTYTASIEVFKSGGWKGEAMDSVTKWEDEKDYTLTCEKFDTAGVKIVTIESKIATGVKCYFYVYVKDPQTGEVPKAKISDIKLENAGPIKTSYLQGDKLDLSGILMTGICNGYKINLPYTSEPANGTTLTAEGESYVTFYYEGKELNKMQITVTKPYTVEFYDGIDNSKPLYTLEVVDGDTLKLPSSPERENYIFVGWYNGEIKIESGYLVTGNLKLTAKWYEPVYVYDFTIKVTNLPENVKALSLWGSCNDWKLENIEADKDSYIVDVIDGTATFAFDKIGYGTYLWCQFVPMTSKDMAMDDYTWWHTAFCGSSAYANAENNLVYNKPLANKVTLTLDVSAVYGDIISEENVFVKRFNTENYENAFQVSTGECKYKIIYNGADGYSDYLMTSFDEEYDITLMNLGYKDDYKFAGWYETEDFSGNPITGWKAGEKKSDVTLYAKWDKAKEIIIRFDVNGEDDETTPDTIVTKEGKRIELPYMGTYFSHWNTKADGSGKTYYSYEYVSFTEDITLYAQWCEKVTITFNANGGSDIMEKQIIPASKYFSLAENTFTAPAGYFFSHWNTKADDSGESYADTSRITLTEDITLYAQWKKGGGYSETGIYSYKLDIVDISSNVWGATTTSPTFSVFLLTDEQLADCYAAQNFSQATAGYEYQIFAFGNMKIADTSQTGDYAVYGQEPVDGVYQYYDGVAVTVTDTTFELFVDMSKIVNTQLWARWFANQEARITEDDIVDLAGYKPYVIALGTETADFDNYVFSAWSADVMKMSSVASFPTNLQYAAPANLTCNDLKYIAGTMTNWNCVALTDNSFTFTANSDTEFVFTNDTWDFIARGATIYALDEEIALSENSDANITFIDGVLTVGNEYVVTLIVKGEHEAYVKVTAKE